MQSRDDRSSLHDRVSPETVRQTARDDRSIYDNDVSVYTSRESEKRRDRSDDSRTEVDDDDEAAVDASEAQHPWNPIQLSENDEAELKRIATIASIQERKLSTIGTWSDAPEDSPVFDPASKEFDLYKWLRKFLRSLDEADIKLKRAGVAFRNVTVSGSGSALSLQQNVGSLLMTPFRLGEILGHRNQKRILKDFNGLLKSGELLIVLGRPGSGCSTLLKTMCGEFYGLHIDNNSVVHYNGIPQKQMLKEFKGEVVYNQEVDKHFPHLTVGQTLEFAASVRTPSRRVQDISRQEWAKSVTKVVMAVLGLSHTYNTKVGSDYIRGVSGGERKRVSIAEMAVSGAPLAAWDNSTRGLDAASALEFVNALRTMASLTGTAHAVACYQASQAIYDVFDKAIVLYDGREIYFGPAKEAKKFFENQGWYCPPRQTTGDFLTSVTNPLERRPREGMENKVPRTAEEFEQYWRESEAFQSLQKELDQYEKDFPLGGETVAFFQETKRIEQAKHTNPKSPYLISVPMQIRLNTKRAYQRMWNDRTSTVANVIGQVLMALLISSIFYGTPDATQGFSAKNSTLFFAVLLNALSAITEINSLYSQRAIIEKHASYAFYHPFTEAVAGVIADIPVKFLIAIVFNVVLYFMANLGRTASQFFLYFLIVFISTLVMSAIFRTTAAVTKTISQAMAFAGVMVLAIAVYVGFIVPKPYMKPWFKWISYINPIYYAFEILMANEYHGRQMICSEFVPAYPDMDGDTFVCAIAGAVAGQRTVSGDDYIATFGYYYSHVWRNFGILCAFLVFFMVLYFAATQINSSTTSTAEALVFRRGHVPAYLNGGSVKGAANDVEMTAPAGNTKESTQSDEVNVIPPQKDIFTWKEVVYDIEIKGEPRRLLDHVSGWVKPKTLTALMGVSGAGKTTLLDALAQRTSIGVITGEMLVNGRSLDSGFQRKTGYVQQQDLHLHTATVRESLRFSAVLRQPKSVSTQEKYRYVESVIKMLNMEDFAEAVVGVPGEGLNVEQRKLLTIGVELAAKPKLLLFLDEPTSGLDSQSSWAICSFLRKLADSGQAILCTIHQPSAVLFQEFDRLLFLAKGGKTVYFGDIGKNSTTLLNYFEANGARKCGNDENPAEYMLEIVGAGASGQASQDWHEVWKGSQECQAVEEEIENIKREKLREPVADDGEDGVVSEFAMPFSSQLYHVTYRAFQQYWRMPTYIWAKVALGVAAGLFIGFSTFQSDNSLQGLQNVIFSIFMVITIFSTLVQQIMPLFVTQRSLYEVRERPSKAYSWKAFIFANIFVEIPYQIVLGIFVFACYYYAVVGVQSSDRQGLVLLYCIQFFIYASSFAHMMIAGLPDTETAGAITTLFFSLIMVFNGVLQSPSALPGFWIFMYRLSPFTYWVGGVASTELHGRPVECSASETSIFNPPFNMTCGQYLAPYLEVAPGYIRNPAATSDCHYCALSNADQYMAGSDIYWSQRWRNFGIVWVFVFFNIFMTIVLYWVFRIKKWKLSSSKPTKVSTEKNASSKL